MPYDVIHEAFFTDYHEEAAQILETFPIPDILRMLQSTSGENAANLLSCLSPSLAAEIITVMPTDLLSKTLSELSPDHCGLVAASGR